MYIVLVDSVVDVHHSCMNHICCFITGIPRPFLKFDDGDGDKLKFKIVSEIIADWSPTTFGLLLEFKENQRTRILLYPDPNHPENIFKGLWNLFHSDVKLSVRLKYGQKTDVELTNLVAFQELLIQENCSEVLGSTHSTKPSFEPGPKVHVKIVAHFPTSMTSCGDLPNRMILEDGLFSDVIIVAANGAEIKGHKSFLAARSSVLMATFRNEMQESVTGRLDMTDVSEKGVWAFLRYLYYGDLWPLQEDIDVAFNVLYAAHKYHVRSLEAEAIQCLMKRKSEDYNVAGAFKIYMFARNVESTAELKAKVVQILKIKLDELESLEEFQELFQKSSNAKIALEVFKDFAKLSST